MNFTVVTDYVVVQDGEAKVVLTFKDLATINGIVARIIKERGGP